MKLFTKKEFGAALVKAGFTRVGCDAAHDLTHYYPGKVGHGKPIAVFANMFLCPFTSDHKALSRYNLRKLIRVYKFKFEDAA